MKIRTAMTAAILMLTPTLALAQSTIRDGAQSGAAAGGEVLGPVGAAVGGTVGAAVGTAVAIPDAVIGAVRGANAPTVVVRDERIAVGEPLPSVVVLRPVPRYEQYSYAVVNDQRVVVDPQTRRIVRIID